MLHLFRKYVFAAGLFMMAALFHLKLHAQQMQSNSAEQYMTYQASVINSDGKPVEGEHTITLTFYSDKFGKNDVWHGDYPADLMGGYLSLLLGGSRNPLPNSTAMDRPLWVGIKVDGGNELEPRTQLTAVPYALNIPDKSVTEAKLAPDLQSAIFGANHSQTVQAFGNQWSQGGDAIGANSWIGSTDAYDVEVHVYDGDATHKGSKRVMGYYHNSVSPNIVGGYYENLISSGTGSVICGGGTYGAINEIRSDLSAIVGGNNNLIDATSSGSVILGGNTNSIALSNLQAYIGAGTNNQIHDTCNYSVILGGIGNTINNSCKYSFIGGGNGNSITSSGITNAGQYCSVIGGDHVTAQGYAQTVLGAYNIAQGTSTKGTMHPQDGLFIIGNGDAFTHSNAFQVLNNGTSVVYNTNGSSNDAITGATYKDNIIYAWGYWENGHVGGAALVGSFGTSVTQVGAGVYNVTLNLIKPDGITHTCLNNTEAAVIVTPYNQTCYNASVSSLSNNGSTTTTFTITITQPTVNPPGVGHPDYWLGCNDVVSDFMFIVVGRPH